MGMTVRAFDGMSLRMFGAIAEAFAAAQPAPRRGGRRPFRLREAVRGGLDECP